MTNHFTALILELYDYYFLICGLISGQITMEEIEQYKQELSVFAESFSMHGPGAVGENLEKGMNTCSLIF